MVHRILWPDWNRRRQPGRPRLITWNDKSGHVSGNHSQLDLIRDAIKARVVSMAFGDTTLQDPAHDKTEFITVLAGVIGPGYVDPHAVLPAQLRHIEPRFDAPTPIPGVRI